jgi:hypothetical protein
MKQRLVSMSRARARSHSGQTRRPVQSRTPAVPITAGLQALLARHRGLFTEIEELPNISANVEESCSCGRPRDVRHFTIRANLAVLGVEVDACRSVNLSEYRAQIALNKELLAVAAGADA